MIQNKKDTCSQKVVALQPTSEQLLLVLTQDTLVVDQVEVNHGHRRPHAQQGEDDEPGEEAAAARARLRLLPVLIGRLGLSGIWKETQTRELVKLADATLSGTPCFARR